MSDLTITVVIPTFQRSQLLKRAIQSVLSQSYRQVTVHVYDNASQDDTEAVVTEISRQDPRVIYRKNPKNIGGSANMALGVSQVTAPLYSLLNDDDFLLPGFFECAIEAFRKHPEAGFVCAKAILVNVSNGKCKFRNTDWSPGLYKPSREIIRKMFRSHFCQTGVLLRREMRDLIGPFEASGNDILYTMMGAAAVPFVVLDGHGALLTLHPTSYSALGGLSSEEVDTLLKAYATTTAVAAKLPIDDPVMKGELLMLIGHAYAALIESRHVDNTLNNLVGRASRSMSPLPPRVSSSGLLLKVLGQVPPGVRHAIAFGAQFQRRNKNVPRWRKSSIMLSPEAMRFFSAVETNISVLTGTLHAVGAPYVELKAAEVL